MPGIHGQEGHGGPPSAVEGRERSEQRFLDVIEVNADAIVVVGAEGAIRYANCAAERLFRKDRNDLTGTVFGFPLVGGETTELDLNRPGEPPVVVEMRVVESEWDAEPAWIASLRDITERKEAERAARELIQEQTARSVAESAARRFEFLAESGPALSASLDPGAVLSTLARLCVPTLADWVMVYVVGPGGRVGRIEAVHRDPALQSKLAELRDEEIDTNGSHPVLEVVRSREPLLIHDIDEEALASIAADPRHHSLLRELGFASVLLLPLVARDHSVGAIGLAYSTPDRRFDDDDVTLAADLAHRAALALDNARLYNEARDADQAKSDLLAVISHDLKTPLSSIIGYADLLISGIPEPIPDVCGTHVKRIRSGAGHLLHLIEELLAFARLDAGRTELKLELITIQDVVREVSDLLEPLAHTSGLDLIIELPEGPVALRTDPGKLRQILVNLASNGLKFTERGSVTIAAEPMDGHARVRVSDTGRGIAPEHLDQIFQPFWRGDREVEGSGLGLSVVQRLTSLLGGEASVTSEPGVGTTFTVSLPRHMLDASQLDG